MFATLLGAYPLDAHPAAAGPAAAGPAAGETADELARGVIEELESAGLEPLTDGGVRGLGAATAIDADAIVAAWRFAASCTSRAVKQSILGPWSRWVRDEQGVGSASSPEAGAELIAKAVAGLASAGCPLVEIEEPEAVRIGTDDSVRRRFGDLQRRVLDAAGSAHLSLALTGGNVDVAGAATFFDLPYASYAFDLIAGPDNWRLIAQAPGDRGIVCGALDPAATSADRPELLIWAAHYAASTNGRGLVRVGLANASSLAGLSRERARRKVTALAEAARLASGASTEELAAALDPRAIDIRSAALGRFEPGASRRARAGRQAPRRESPGDLDG